MRLNTEPNLAAPDDFYEALIDTHQGLSAEQSHALNAKLVLLLANHIGAQDVLCEALAAARRSTETSDVSDTNDASDAPEFAHPGHIEILTPET